MFKTNRKKKGGGGGIPSRGLLIELKKKRKRRDNKPPSNGFRSEHEMDAAVLNVMKELAESFCGTAFRGGRRSDRDADMAGSDGGDLQRGKKT